MIITRLFMKFLAVFLLLACVIGCQELYKEPEIQDLKDFVFFDYSSEQLNVGFKAVLYNPNSIKVEIEEFESEILVRGEKLGIGKSTQTTILNNKDTSIWEIQGFIDIHKLYTLYPEIIKKDSVRMDLKSQIIVRKPKIIGKRPLERNLHYYFNANKFLRDQVNLFLSNGGLTIKKIEPSLSLKNSTFKIEGIIRNDFPFDLKIHKLDIKEKSNNISSTPLKWILDNPILVKANQKEKIDIQIEIANSLLLSHFGRLLLNPEEEIVLKGTCDVEILGLLFSIPFEQKAPIIGASNFDTDQLFDILSPHKN